MSEENSPRKQISKKVRFEVFKRDLFKCAYCGRTPPAVVLHVDHIHPVSKGGKNTQDNLITACLDCNLGKSNIPLSVVPESMAEKALRMAEMRDQLKAFSKLNAEIENLIVTDCWRVVHEIYGENVHEVKTKTFGSIRIFVEKLGVTDVLSAARTMQSKVGSKSEYQQFLYFCGICWKKIKEQNQCQ